jgi:GNAT superfamily N-acetyltransferase
LSPVVRIGPEDARERVSQLCDLLTDAVDSGASVGFMPPLSLEDALAYWASVIAAMREGSRVLLVAQEDGLVQGSVQLGLEMRGNGLHRAEMMKLFVHRRARRRGLARALLAEAERVAAGLGRTLLTMDTRKGGEAERLCESLGYVRYGEVPGYARSSDGSLHTTTFFYRRLD